MGPELYISSSTAGVHVSSIPREQTLAQDATPISGRWNSAFL